MHGTFNAIDTTPAISDAFTSFIVSLYVDRIIPPIRIVDDVTDEREFYKRTGCIAVLSEDEDADCPAFDDWGHYYSFMGWLNYRALSQDGNEFSRMVKDVIDHKGWSPETAKQIGVLNALVVVQEEYAERFGHYPVNLDRFIKTCTRSGAEVVLLADLY